MKKYLFILLLLFSMGLYAQKVVPNELIVELNDDRDINDLQLFLNNNRSLKSLKIARKLSQRDEIYLLKTVDNESVNPRDIVSNELFKYVTPSRLTKLRETPDDTFYLSQWHLPIIDIERAWDITTGGKTIDGDDIVIAVLDDGFYLDLEDWGDNIFQNPFEQLGDSNGDGCPGDCGVDDDNDGLIDEDGFGRVPGDPNYDNSFNGDDDENGYIDDITGLNASTQNDSHTEITHGTASAGIIGAKGNNGTGITGVNWDIKILPLSSGLKITDIIETYNYITDMRRLYNETDGEKGAFIVVCNYSLGVDYGFPEDYPIWCSLYDKMGEQGIINVSAVSNENYNVDSEGDIPTLCDSDYLISVTGTDADDNFPDFAFGRENVDIAGPGKEAFSIRPTFDSGYGRFSGTSASAPHVAGVIGLMYSTNCPGFLEFFKENPSKVDSLAELIVQSGDELESLRSLVRSEKRINAYNALVEVNKFCGATSGEVNITSLYPNPTANELNFTFKADPLEKIYLKIYNILGQEVYSEEKTFPLFETPEGTVNTSDLIPGIYFFSLQQTKGVATYKFYKE